MENVHVYVYVTWHQKIGLMCTKYTASHYYYTYLTFCDRYTSSVKCFDHEQLIVCCTNSKHFIVVLCLIMKLQTSINYGNIILVASQLLCELILKNQSNCHIWYFNKYQFQIAIETTLVFLCQIVAMPSATFTGVNLLLPTHT